LCLLDNLPWNLVLVLPGNERAGWLLVMQPAARISRSRPTDQCRGCGNVWCMFLFVWNTFCVWVSAGIKCVHGHSLLLSCVLLSENATRSLSPLFLFPFGHSSIIRVEVCTWRIFYVHQCLVEENVPYVWKMCLFVGRKGCNEQSLTH
jgi:hypothetical protein